MTRATGDYFGKRTFDLVTALIGLVVLVVPMGLIALLVRISSAGPALYWSQRVGKDNEHFWMPKVRTMRLDAPVVATHLLADPHQYVTRIGLFLRRTSLDEAPQLWSVLVGDMSIVGPRPALFNQDDLIALRTASGVHRLKPGITGWAQINGRDELPISMKVKYDVEYLERVGFWFDCKVILLTVVNVLRQSGVSH